MRNPKISPRTRDVLASAAAALLVAAPASAQMADRTGSSERAIHLLQRATYGPRPEDLAAVESVGIESWLDRQLHPERIDDREAEERLAGYPATHLPIADMSHAYLPRRFLPPREERMRMRQRGGPGEAGVRSIAHIVPELAWARLQRAVGSERQLEAVMTEFWFDHFNVDGSGGAVSLYAADYERTAIRPHVFGRFEDMLRATARHPAMLVYLDNFRSVAAGARWRGIPGGVNENYARELLELHTLGVSGGYDQTDVEQVALAFTGWTLERHPAAISPSDAIEDERLRARLGRRYEYAVRDPDAGDVTFVFRLELHDTTEKTVLGRTLPAGRGMEDGLDVLAILARHPSTARHLATQLAQAFVADEPPPALVDELAEVYLRTDGDLRELTRALFLSPRFSDPAVRGGKVRSPFQFLAAALRMSVAEVRPESRAILEFLWTAGQVPYAAKPPTGYPETGSEWLNGGALIQRTEFATALAAGEVDGVAVDPRALVGGRDPVEALLARLLPGVDTGRLEPIVRERAGTPGQALGLILASPEFQTR